MKSVSELQVGLARFPRPLFKIGLKLPLFFNRVNSHLHSPCIVLTLSISLNASLAVHSAAARR